MTEYIKNTPASWELNKDLTSDEQCEAYILEAIKSGQQLASERFSDTSTLETGCGLFVHRFVETAASIDGLYETLLSVRGPGVLVPRFDAAHDDSGGLHFDMHMEAPLRSLDIFEEKRGRLESITLITRIAEEDKHQAVLYLVLRDDIRHNFRVNTNYGFPMTEVNLTSRILVACDGTADVEIPALTSERARRQAIARLALQCGGNEHDSIVRKAHRLKNALHHEDIDRFISLRSIEDVRQLGVYGREQAAVNQTKSEAVVDVLRETLGRNRTLKIIGDMSFGANEPLVFAQTLGRVIDVLPEHPGLDEPEPTLVVSCQQSERPESALCYVPVSRIESLDF